MIVSARAILTLVMAHPNATTHSTLVPPSEGSYSKVGDFLHPAVPWNSSLLHKASPPSCEDLQNANHSRMFLEESTLPS